MIVGVRKRLIDAIKQRLRADVKVGVSLSGGIDSSVVAGVVNHLIREGHQIGSEDVNERLNCFGIAFDEDSGFDESATANRTADFLGVKFHKKHMNEAELARSFADATWHDEQPNPDLNFIGTYALSELFREQGFRVNINGQGADEILSGYNIFLPDFLREPDNAFSGPTISEDVREAELHKAEERLNKVYGDKLDLSGTSVARRQLNNTLTPAQMTAAFPPLPFKEGFLPSNNKIDPQLTYAESITGMMLDEVANKWHPLHTAQYTFCKAHLQNLLLSNLGDRGEMAHSIEGRTPFLDHHLTEYVNNLPPSMKIRRDEKGDWVEKYILREAAKPFITEEIYQKRKHPYSAPVEYPKDGPMYKLLKELVTDDNVAKLGFLKPGGIGNLVEEVFETREMSTFRLVICLAQWVVLQRRFGVRETLSETERAGSDDLKLGTNVMLG
jgi:asparagine synthase (glutamine-hydrolysing)